MAHPHTHDHPHPRPMAALPASIMAAGAMTRIGVALVAVGALWLAIWWAAAQP